MVAFIAFTYSVVDGKGENSRITLFVTDYGTLDDNYTTSELNQFANVTLPIIRNVLVGGVVRCTITIHADLADLYASFPSLAIPEEYADVEEIGKTLWTPVDGWLKPTEINFPTFDETLLIPGTREIDDADLRFVALINLLTSGITLTPGRGIQYGTKDGAPFAFYFDGKEKFKRREYKKRKR